MSAPRGMRTCPYCAEDVREEETKCPYCDSNVTPLLPTKVAIAAVAQVPPVSVPVQAIAANPPRGGLAVAALVLGVVGLVCSLVPLLGIYCLPLTVLAIVFGILARAHGMGVAGLVCGLIGTLIGAYWIYVIISVAEDMHDAVRRVEHFERTTGPSCRVGDSFGVCIETRECAGRSVEGYCYGDASIQCCLR